MSNKKLVLIDGNNLFTRYYFAAKTSHLEPIEFCMKRFIELRKEYADARFVFTFDTCKSKRRLELYPEYKGSRSSSLTEEEYLKFKNDLNMFMRCMKYAGYIVMEGHDYEADDYIAAFQSMVRLNYSVLLISTDADFVQLISKSFKIFDPFKKILITEDRVEKAYGFKQSQALDYKCIVGDKSDNIKGYQGIGDITAKKLLTRFDNFEKIFEYVTNNNDLTAKEKTLKDRSIYDRNKELCDLTIPIKDPTLKMLVKQFANGCKREFEKLHELLCEKQLGHMTKEIDVQQGDRRIDDGAE